MKQQEPGEESREDGGDACRDERPTSAEIRNQLDRITGSPAFSVPERLRHFFSYVVEETLAGRSRRIKAYSIATEVFGRDANFDIQNDPVVRIEAGRLRRALERYYLVAGQFDPVLIDIPKGGYVPQFSLRSQPTTERSPREASALPGPPSGWQQRWTLTAIVVAVVACAAVYLALAMREGRVAVASRWEHAPQPEVPSLVVKPFRSLTDDKANELYAIGFTEEILVQLAKFRELTVLGRETSQAISSGATARQIRREFGSRYALEGTVRVSEGRMRVTARVLDSEGGAIVWSQSYDADLRTSSIFEIEAAIASQVATAVAQPYGVIFRPLTATDEKRPDSMEAYQCSARFYRYRSILSPNEHVAARHCLELVTARFPGYATGWAMLSYLYLDEDRFQLNRRLGTPTAMDRAREAAERAVRLDPQNVRSLQALMTVLFFGRRPEEALSVGARALALNPNDTELLGEYGSRVAQAGHWKRGASLLEQALTRNPGNSPYYVGMLALAAYMQGDDTSAVDLIGRADLKRFSIYHFVAALIFSRAGHHLAAYESRDEFLRMRPDFFDDFWGELDKRNFSARDRALLMEGARRVGFPVKPAIATSTQ